jgi:hypothetical protein
MHPFDTLLEKAKAAHYHWIVNNPQMTQTKAMAELGDAIQDAEATKSKFYNFKVLECKAFKVTSYIGDKQVMLVCLDTSEEGEPYFTIEIRTLTKTPEEYGYTDILRRINGYFYIRNSFGMRVAVWSAFLEAVGCMREKTTKAMMEFLDKKEKQNGR